MNGNYGDEMVVTFYGLFVPSWIPFSVLKMSENDNDHGSFSGGDTRFHERAGKREWVNNPIQGKAFGLTGVVVCTTIKFSLQLETNRPNMYMCEDRNFPFISDNNSKMRVNFSRIHILLWKIST